MCSRPTRHIAHCTAMGSDFKSCRFDFRLDGKTGLQPSRPRRRGCSTAGARTVTATTGGDISAPRTHPADSGGRCSTLYSCKICGCLLRSRADRKAHTLQHKQDSLPLRVHRSRRNTDLKSSESIQPYMIFGVTHPLREAPPLLVESALMLPELGTADFEWIRSSFQTRKTPAESLTTLPSSEVPQDSDVITGIDAATSGMTSSPLYFRSLNDVIGSCDSNSASAVGSTTDDSIFRGTNSSDRQTDKVLDLTTKTVDENHDRLPVVSKEDFRSPLVRQRKSRGLDLTVQKLWQFKLQMAAANDSVTFRDLERSRSRDGDGNGGDNLGSSRRYDDEAIQTRRLEEERPSFETTKVTETRLLGECEGHTGAELTLRRVVASPGEQPLFYTSLMRLQSTRRKSQPTMVAITCLTYLLLTTNDIFKRLDRGINVF